MGAPALLGGYEYTPDEMNGRKSEKLVKKHNEALKVMPHLFYNAGYSVTLTDPCDANYNNKFGFEVFDDYPEMDVKSVMGKYNSIYSALHDEDAQFSLDDDKTIKKTSRQFSIMQILPPFVRDSFYDGGHYYLLFPKFQASPNRFNLLDSYSALYFMKDFTKFDGTKKTFIMQYNLLMHEPMELRAPDYTPGEIDENHPAAGTGFYKYRSKSDSNGFNDFAAYHVNAASIKMVGEWLSYLKQNDCYDNTRIIIVADHGHHVPLECFGNEKSKTVYASFNPLLLFKDFYSHGEFKTDFKFMTNAETVNLATEGLDEIEGKNPFTGKKFSHAEDFKSFNVYTPKAGERGSARMKEKFVFETEESRSFSVYGNIFDEKNWDRPKSE
jgi:arylsulfatase A-like enzyme